MFGRGKKSSGPPKSDQVRKPQATDMFGMPDLSAYAVKEEFDVSNEALEAELAALLEEEDDAPKMTRQRRPAPAQPTKSADPMRQIDAMAAEALRDTDDALDDDDDDEDEDLLLAELADITQESSETLTPPSTQQKRTPSPTPSPKMTTRPTPQPSPASQSAPAPGLRPGPSNVNRSPSPARKAAPSPVAPSPAQTQEPSEPADINTVLQQRAQSYQQAIAAAEAAGESSKVRRYKRQLKTLQDMLRKIKLGKPIDKDEIPPEVCVPKPAADQQPPPQEKQPVPEAAPVAAVSQPISSPAVQPEQPDTAQSESADADQLKLIGVRRDQYKMAALLAKRSGDMKTAAEHLKVSKQFDLVIKALEAGQQVDLSEMPGPPSQPAPAAPQPAPVPQPRATAPTAPGPSTAPGPGPSTSSEEEPPTPKTDLEAMLQRRGVYKSMADKAKEENNDSKTRRIGRIVKQYEDAIRKQKLGKPVDLSELPSLPTFPPFPSQAGGQAAPSVAQAAAPVAPPAAAAPVVSAAAGASSPPARTAGQATQPAASRPPAPTRQMSAKENMYQRNVAILKDRIAQFRKLALEAKRRGDIYEAKRLLKISKEIEPMLTAAEGGLPVNLDSIPKLPRKEPEAVSPPTSPEPDGDFEMVADGSAEEVYKRLIATLNKQIELCEANAKVYGKLGNIKSAKRFEEFKDSCQQDIDLLISKQSRGETIPRHHYEQRTLPSVRVCPDVKENEAEITIVQGLQLHCPNEKDSKDIDTYIKAEFPYPSDDPPTHKTGWAKGAVNPQYNSSCMVEINRGSRAFNSAVKRKALKLEIIYSKGLLRGHKTLGTASLKLAELENKCELHESIPLMDGRREIGGKIEVKIRLHHPLSGLKEDFVKEKWLVVDSVHKKTKVSSPPAAASKKTSSSSSASGSSSGSGHRTSATDSIEILKWEIGTLKKKIADMQAHKQQVPNEFAMSYRTLQERLQKLQIFLKEGGSQARNAYLTRLQALSPSLLAQAKEALQAGQKEKASMFMTRRKLVDAEIASLSRR
ncbi:coiled-coil and C2 domain-containing protein 1-like isoform X1 [Lytechinus variegatus]|uniref:coiled-coil and C2 domain-containing protein 1-like isoform X1 n=1 Tax=Lytechinus variegatus TaxID=7654 RepID=UPI001BB1C40A|nr:coiled-coil and C2 domain-containing protein 1-like isoform X1 [Lytechinus variegatus]